MKLFSIESAVVLAIGGVAGYQIPFGLPSSTTLLKPGQQTARPLLENKRIVLADEGESGVKLSEGDAYIFKKPVKKVALIGAGPGGLVTFRELSQAGFDVHLFERDSVPGGNWHYTDETPADAPIPNADVVVGDYTPSLPPHRAELPYVEVYDDAGESDREYTERRRHHRAPKPLWYSLKSNAPAPIQQIRELPWPRGTPWELPQSLLQGYLRAFASYHGINSNDVAENSNVHYNTRVERVSKNIDPVTGDENGWRVVTKEFKRVSENQSKATWREEIFDAVVVASGRWNAPNIPNITGLKELNSKFPERILHARQYRYPHVFKNETILIVGAAVSGGEISKDINPHAKKIYQSIRPESSTLPHLELRIFLRRLPHNTTVIGEIASVKAAGARFQDAEIKLVNGTVITGIDRLIFATGYRYTFPFLPQYHNATLGPKDEAPRGRKDALEPIVTDGTHLRGLHLDLFYIPDPTLVFLNMNVGMQSFTYVEFLALAVAQVWKGNAHLPSRDKLWELYDEKVKRRGGYTKYLLYLGGQRTEAALRYFIGWLNLAAQKNGGRQIDTLPLETEQISEIWFKARFGSEKNAVLNALPSSHSTPPPALTPFVNASLHALGYDVGSDEVARAFSPAAFAADARDRVWREEIAYSDWW